MALVLTLCSMAGLLGALAPPASAQGTPNSDRPFSHRRYLLGLSGIAAVATSKDLDPSPGVQVRIGARVHRHFAVEGFGEWHNRFDDSFRHYSAWGAGMNVRAYALTRRIQPFLLVGGGAIMRRKMGGGEARSSLGFAPRAGLGLDYYLNRDLAISLDATYVIPIGAPAGLDFVSINWGLQWH